MIEPLKDKRKWVILKLKKQRTYTGWQETDSYFDEQLNPYKIIELYLN